MGLSPASVSERLATLETYYGATLLNRTTRAISLTDEGKLLVEGARRLLAEAGELHSSIRAGTQTLSGPIRMSAPQDLGRQYIDPILSRFLDEHPDVSLDLDLGDGYVDLVSQGLDFAIRYGALADSSLRARPLGEKPSRGLCRAHLSGASWHANAPRRTDPTRMPGDAPGHQYGAGMDLQPTRRGASRVGPGSANRQ
nr:hypothetical protein GCM10020185_62500 [Pseudomonas brassicacearum subsp. brassicacearum]